MTSIHADKVSTAPSPQTSKLDTGVQPDATLHYEANLVLARSEEELRRAWERHPDALLSIMAALDSRLSNVPKPDSALAQQAFRRLCNTSVVAIYQERISWPRKPALMRHASALTRWCGKLAATMLRRGVV
jgi:hypothetical protein